MKFIGLLAASAAATLLIAMPGAASASSAGVSTGGVSASAGVGKGGVSAGKCSATP